MDARVALPLCLLLAVLDQSVWGQDLTTTNYEDNDDTTTPEFPDITADIVTGKVSITNTSEEYTTNIGDSLTTNATESYQPTSDDVMVTDATTIYDNHNPESTTPYDTPNFDAITHSRTITEDASAVTARTHTNPQQSGTVSEVDYTSSQNPKFSTIGVQKPLSKSPPKPSPASSPSQTTPGAKTTSVPFHSTNKQVTTLEKSTTRPDTDGQTTACTTQTGAGADRAGGSENGPLDNTTMVVVVSLGVWFIVMVLCCILVYIKKKKKLKPRGNPIRTMGPRDRVASLGVALPCLEEYKHGFEDDNLTDLDELSQKSDCDSGHISAGSRTFYNEVGHSSFMTKKKTEPHMTPLDSSDPPALDQKISTPLLGVPPEEAKFKSRSDVESGVTSDSDENPNDGNESDEKREVGITSDVPMRPKTRQLSDSDVVLRASHTRGGEGNVLEQTRVPGANRPKTIQITSI